MMLAAVGVLLAGVLVLFGFGQALGAKGQHQRAADLAAVSAAQVMRDLYPRLFEPPFLEPDVPNPRHLEQEAYLELARAAAVRGARRNGVRLGAADVSFPTAGFAPTRVTVRVRGEARVRVGRGSPAAEFPSAPPPRLSCRRPPARGCRGRRAAAGMTARWHIAKASR